VSIFIDFFFLFRRILEDLTLALLEPEVFNCDIVFRTWDEALVPENELRCFVSNAKVTAITQYYSSLYVEKLHQEKDDLEKRVLVYLEEIIPCIPNLDSYTLDVGIRSDNSLSIVELNPPAPRR
jgi:hypothetical protein